MTDLPDLLRTAGVHRALIVDDAYDEEPLSSDLAEDSDEWTQFFDDLTGQDRLTLIELFPGFGEIRADELQISDEFVCTLWRSRTRLRRELVGPLFARYEAAAASDLEYLKSLAQRLREFGLECNTAGRGFEGQAAAADLIVIDLFLGSTQNDAAITTSIDGLLKVIDERRSRPPLVLLMSSSNRLEEMRQEFRDRSRLFESAFRIIHKRELADAGKLLRLLTRLASHYADSLKLAAFLDAWDSSLMGARERSSSLIRTLGLADLAQIRQLMLSAEGEPTGSYMVDVFDRVLQHEVEREPSIIDTAIALNTLTTETYPPPYFAGSPDLQNLVYRSLFEHPERLRLIGAEESRVAFGDVLRRKAVPAAMGAAVPPDANHLLSDIARDKVLVVVTPACDLQREGAKRVLLLVGALRPLVPIDWSYKPEPIRTPVIELLHGERSWIKWDLKHVEALSHPELEQLLAAVEGFEIIARIRESHALELQQKLLSNLGRVGLIAQMPATFPMRIEVFLPGQERQLVSLDIPVLKEFGGVRYVGRSGQRLVLCEDACEAICEDIEQYDLSTIHPTAREAVTYLRDGDDLLQALTQGVPLPSAEAQGFQDIRSPSGALDGEGPKARVRIIGLLKINGDTATVRLTTREAKNAGIVLAAWDEHPS